ncbi:MAG: DNA primase [Desulfurococcaceae archaeon]
MSSIDLKALPFLVPLERLMAKYPGMDLRDFISSPGSRARERLVEIFKSIVGGLPLPRSQVTLEEEAIAFYALLCVAKGLNEPALANRIAVAYSKAAMKALERAEPGALVAVARELGLHAVVSDRPVLVPSRRGRRDVAAIPLEIALPFDEYLRIIAGRLAQDPAYSLSNAAVRDGLVFVDAAKFVRLLGEAIHARVLEMARGAPPLKPEEVGLGELAKELEGARWRRRRAEEAVARAGPEAYPPCMARLLERQRAGENLSHHERFALAAFLLNIGMGVDEVLEAFRSSPDFNEKIARYQIEHIAGLRGSKKKYLPYGCDTMKSLGICPVEGYCTRARNPLGAYKILSRAYKPREAAGGRGSLEDDVSG